ncbi:MAG: HAMP domain-containing histidine kinase [Burkholderiales bacterium]|nr:HAMP domain-containing histidine kinase [Burkholderiales bacterium]MDE1927911.1 HAMP domain-containing histidine kinase [Burkholderiales bacterium]MDE2503689.1 HAMP domain-containing histidine kinase [Burkholderiales bacterium]
MTVRLRLALTIFLTGLATALGVIVTVAIAFQRFEHESTYERADAFLSRVTAQHVDLLGQRERDPQGFLVFLRNLLLYAPDTQLYLLDDQGTVLAHTGRVHLAPGFKVALAPVREAADVATRRDIHRAAFVMGQDPEYMDADAVIAARALQRAPDDARALQRAPDDARALQRAPAPGAGPAGYLYLVSRKPGLPATRMELLRSSVTSPALLPALAVVLAATGLALWIIAAVTRPLRVLSDEVDGAARTGFDPRGGAPAAIADAPAAVDDEIARLRRGFHALLARLRMQWDELRRLDHFRREGVSNLSHDLRSPLTATVACLETLEARWGDAPARTEDRELVAVALRNTRNAAAMVRALGDLAQLDEPEFELHPLRLDLGEVLDDIALRYAPRYAERGVALRCEQAGGAAPLAEVDIELFERAVANLLDNALKFTPAGRGVVVATARDGAWVRVVVEDEGCGIAASELPRLFERLYRVRGSVAPASSEEGKGLGLAIVKRIVELHRGRVAVTSRIGAGTRVTIELPGA